MSAPIIAFFNNRVNVSVTSLVYHLTWMYAELGARVLVADLDPQATLTTHLLPEERLEYLWPEGDHPNTIFGCVEHSMKDTADIAPLHLEQIEEAQLTSFFSPVALLAGDVLLSRFEDTLSEAWLKCLKRSEHSFRSMAAFWRVMQRAATDHQADVILMDVGPNLDAINRAALIAADYIFVPLSPDLLSLQGLRNLGLTLRRWRSEWKDRLQRNTIDLQAPQGRMELGGYIVWQHSLRLYRPVQAYGRWIARIPKEYRKYVLDEQDSNYDISVTNDPYCLTLLNYYDLLLPLAWEAHKPMFHLKPADGAMGAYLDAALHAFRDFQQLARKIAERTHISLPTP